MTHENVEPRIDKMIAALYGGASEAELATTITYEDGRQATIQSRLRIEDVEEVAARV